MWLAVCSEKHCEWEHHADSRMLAEAHLHWHVFKTEHRAVVVLLPYEGNRPEQMQAA